MVVKIIIWQRSSALKNFYEQRKLERKLGGR